MLLKMHSSVAGRAVVQGGKLMSALLTSHVGTLVPVLAALLPIQLLINVPWTVAKNGLSVWTYVSHAGDLK